MANGKASNDHAAETFSPVNSIAGRLLRIIFGCYFVVTIIVTIVQLTSEYQETETRILHEIDAMQQTFGPGIADAMWRFNEAVLRGIVLGMKELPIVVGVKIEDENSTVVYAVGTIQNEKGQKLRTDINGRLHPISKEDGWFSRMISREFIVVYVDSNKKRRTIGKWTIYSNQRVIIKQIEYGFILILVNSIIKTLALWFIFLYVVQRFLGRPLQQLSNFVGQLNIDNLGDKAFVLEDKGKHELHILSDKLNDLQDNLRKSIAENALLYTQLKLYRDHLEELVEKRTEQLAQTNAKLERSNADLEQFAYVASHDLQEPLRMVISYMQLIEQRYQNRLDADGNEFIAFAVDGAKRMQSLIKDLLSYSRLKGNAKPFQAVDCNAILDVVLHSLRTTIDEADVVIDRAPLPQVTGDATQLTQLFQNLIANAIKFRGERPPRIRISAEANANFWQFMVQDNGIGIAPEHYERIFVMFQRLHSHKKYEGTGIGLALCKKIVEQHGGQISVVSSAEGSTFQFTLPRREQ